MTVKSYYICKDCLIKVFLHANLTQFALSHKVCNKCAKKIKSNKEVKHG